MWTPFFILTSYPCIPVRGLFCSGFECRVPLFLEERCAGVLPDAFVVFHEDIAGGPSLFPGVMRSCMV